MKSVLVKFRDKTFKNFTFVSSLCVFLVACGGQDSVTPDSGDTTGPVITLKDKGTETVVEDNDGDLHYIPTLEINYQTAVTIFYKSESADVLSEIDGKIIGYRQDHTLGESYIDPGFVAYDTYSGTIPLEKTTVFGELDVLDPTEQAITYTATDASDNKSTLKRFFNLIDEIPPKVEFEGDRDRIITLNAIANDEGEFTDREGNLLSIENGASGEDNLVDNIDTTKSKITIRKLLPSNPEGGYEEVTELTTNALADYKIEYSFTDKSGNETIGTRNVFVREQSIAKRAVFENGAVDPLWPNDIRVYDQGINYNACNLGNDCPNIKTAKVNDSEVGRDSKVIQINQLDNTYQSGLFIGSDDGVDLRGSKELGLLQLDIKRQAGSDPYVRVWADCGYPCAGGESRQGPFEIGEWNRIYIPVRDILEGPTSRLDLEIVKAGLLFKSESSRDSSYRLDNVVWLCGEACEGVDIDHVPFDWAATHEDPDQGYQAPTAYDGYALVWSDEFNGNAVNGGNWNFDTGYGDQGWGNGELQFYREENATVDNGLLNITANKHRPRIPELYDPFFAAPAVAGSVKEDIGFTSAKLKTEELFEFRYGRVDARAVAAKGQGLWSAIWMLGANHSQVGWPRSGEIDILDTIGGNRDGLPQEAMLVNNMYWNAAGSSEYAPYSLGSINQNGSAEYWLNEPTDDGYQRPALWTTLPDWMAGPELMTDSGVENDPETEVDESKQAIRPLMLTGCEGPCIDEDNPSVHKTPVDVDNLPTSITQDSAWINWENADGSTETFSNTFHVFSLIWTEDKITFEVDGIETNSIDIVNALEQHYRQTFYLILNVAIGGNWPKAPSDSTAFPDGMLVDYVRVYQADSDCDGIADHDWDGQTPKDLTDDDNCD